MEASSITIALHPKVQSQIEIPKPTKEIVKEKEVIILEDGVGHYYPRNGNSFVKFCRNIYFIGCGIFCCCLCFFFLFVVVAGIANNKN